MKRLTFLFFALALIARAQVGGNGGGINQGGTRDPRWQTVGAGLDSAKPATCVAHRSVYIATDTPATYYCYTTNTWTAYASSGASVQGATNLTTVGDIPYISAAGVLNQDANHFWDSAAHREGWCISSSLAAALHIRCAMAASTPSVLIDSVLLTGGTGTTNFPSLFFQPNGTTAVTTLSTSGTFIGFNAATGFAGNFIAAYTAGGTVLFNVSSTGGVTSASNIQAGTSSRIGLVSKGGFLSPSDGILEAINNAANGFTRMQFGGTTVSFPAIGITSQTNPIITIQDATGGATGQLQIPFIKSSTGQRFVCIDTNGTLVSSTTACVGT